MQIKKWLNWTAPFFDFEDKTCVECPLDGKDVQIAELQSRIADLEDRLKTIANIASSSIEQKVDASEL
jgi:hypothetical protein